MDTELKQAISNRQLNPDVLIKMASNGDNHENLILINNEAVTIAIAQNLHKKDKNFPQIIENAKVHRRFNDLSLLILHAPLDVIESHMDMLLTSSSVRVRIALIERGIEQDALLEDTKPAVVMSLIEKGYILPKMYSMKNKAIKHLLIERGDHSYFNNDAMAHIRAHVILKRHVFAPFVNDQSYLVLSRYLEVAGRDPIRNEKWINTLLKRHINSSSELSKQVVNLALKKELGLELLMTSKDEMVRAIARNKHEAYFGFFANCG